jgi:hypothetical protein
MILVIPYEQRISWYVQELRVFEGYLESKSPHQEEYYALDAITLHKYSAPSLHLKQQNS